MTYAVLATNPATNEIGIALSTITLNCARITPLYHRLLPSWSGRGLIVTAQATANPNNAYKIFELWDQGMPFPEIEKELKIFDKDFSWRQIGAVSGDGEIYGYTGEDAFEHKSFIKGAGSIAIGNFMDGPAPVESMANTLESLKDRPMAERLLSALEAGRDAGGQLDPERGRVPEVFATLIVFDGKQPWPQVDLRVELDLHAIAKLRRLYHQAKRLDPMLKAMFEDPASTFDKYGVVYDIVDAQV